MNADIIKVCEDYQNADIEGVDLEKVVQAADRTINLILKLACETKEKNAALREEVVRHLPTLKRLAKQILDPPDNVFAKIVKDLEAHL